MRFTQEELELLDEETRNKIIQQQQELENYAKQVKEYEMIKQKFAEKYMNPAKRDLYKVMINDIDPNLAKELPDKLPVDEILSPIQDKLKEIDEVKNDLKKRELQSKIFETAAKYNIPDTPEITKDIQEFMKKYNIKDPVAAIELYGRTEWMTKSLRAEKSTMKQRFFNPEDLINADDETITQRIIGELKEQGIF